MTRTCRWLIAVVLVGAGACGFDPRGLGVPPGGARDAAIAGDGANQSMPDDAASATDDASPGIVDARAGDARPIDGKPAPCGTVGDACCAGQGEAPCDDGGECTNGKCTACGALLESCCDPGAICRFGLCVGGGCVSLAR